MASITVRQTIRHVENGDIVEYEWTLPTVDPSAVPQDQPRCNICYVPFSEVDSPIVGCRFAMCSILQCADCMEHWAHESTNPTCAHCRRDFSAAEREKQDGAIWHPKPVGGTVGASTIFVDRVRTEDAAVLIELFMGLVRNAEDGATPAHIWHYLFVVLELPDINLNLLALLYEYADADADDEYDDEGDDDTDSEDIDQVWMIDDDGTEYEIDDRLVVFLRRILHVTRPVLNDARMVEMRLIWEDQEDLNGSF